MEHAQYKKGVELIHKLYTCKEALDEAYTKLDDTIAHSASIVPEKNLWWEDFCILDESKERSFSLVESVIKELNKAIKDRKEGE